MLARSDRVDRGEECKTYTKMQRILLNQAPNAFWHEHRTKGELPLRKGTRPLLNITK